MIFQRIDWTLCTEFGIRRAEHHQRRPPEAVQRVLRHRLLLGRAGAELHHDVVALALVEALLLADADHGAGVGTVGAALQRHLVHDRRAVDQPADGTHVGPGQRRVVEDARILGLAAVELLQQLVAGHAQGLGGAVEVEAVAGLVLHLGEQDRLALQGRRAGDPVALGQLADDLGMRVLRDLPDQGLAIGLGHPLLGLDLDVGVDPVLEGPLLRRHLVEGLDLIEAGLDHLGVHGASPCFR